MAQKLLIIGIIALVYSSVGQALDLERELLLDLYHGIESDQSDRDQTDRGWINLSSGIAPSYEDDFTDIEFSPLQEKQKTQFGVFSGDLVDPETIAPEYKPATPTQFGQSEDERYGVFLKRRF